MLEIGQENVVLLTVIYLRPYNKTQHSILAFLKHLQIYFHWSLFSKLETDLFLVSFGEFFFSPMPSSKMKNS